MTAHQDDNPSGIPLTEEQLLEWIEGRMSPESQAQVERASGRAGLSERVRQMQANRRVMQSLGKVAAPPELAERVFAALEREALVGIADGRDQNDSPPISMVEYVEQRRPSGLRKWVPTFAMAAGVILLVGGGVYWGNLLLNNSRPGKPPTPILPGPIATDTSRGAPGVLSDIVAPAGDNTLVASSNVAAAAADSIESAMVPSTTLAMQNGEISSAAALALARDGRLVMRVRSKDTRRLAQLESPQQAGPNRAWRLMKDVPASVSLAVLPAPRDFVGPVLAMDHARASRLLSGVMSPMIGSGATSAASLASQSVAPGVRAVYLLDVVADELPFAKVSDLLSRQLDADVVLESLPQAVNMPAPTDPERVLWWTQPSSQWTPRVMIPVVVEDDEPSEL